MDGREVIFWLYLSLQSVIALLLFYFSIRVLLTMYTLSPLYKGDVPYVPTSKKSLQDAFRLLNVRPGDKIVDLGCGNGQFLTYGARRVKALFVGVEMNLLLYLVSKLNSLFVRGPGTISVRRQNYYTLDLKRFNKVFMFNMPSELRRLEEKLGNELLPGTMIVSIMFPILSKKFELVERYESKNSLFLYKRVN